MIEFVVPGNPIAKGRPRFVRATGRTFTPKETFIYERVVAGYAALAMGAREPFEGPLRVTIRATFLVPQSWSKKKRDAAVWKTSKPDADNLAKIVDAMNAIVWRDDSQVCELTIQKRYGAIAGLTVSVETLSPTVGVE